MTVRLRALRKVCRALLLIFWRRREPLEDLYNDAEIESGKIIGAYRSGITEADRNGRLGQ